MKTTSILMAAAALLFAGQVSASDHSGVPATTKSYERPLAAEISPFCKAILKGETETVRKMIDLGEDVNRKSLGKTPLIYAARYNRAEIARILLESGADPDRRCDRGYSAVRYAELSGAKDVLKVLEDAMKT